MPFAGGDGSQSNPYQIETWEHLDSVRNNQNSYFVLNNNLDSNTTGYDTYASSNSNGGDGWNPIFDQGVISDINFDGQGYFVKDIYIDRLTASFVGLFGDFWGGTLKNLGVTNATVNGDANVGVIAGRIRSGSASNLFASGTVNSDGGNTLGVLTGQIYSATLSNAYCLGDVSGGFYDMGGITGSMRFTTELNQAQVFELSGEAEGALVGTAEDDPIITGYVDGDTCIPSTAIGSSPDGSTNIDTTVLTTSEMQGSSASTNMTGFDFTNNWETVESGDVYGSTETVDGYPILQSLDGETQVLAQGAEAPPQGLFVWTGSTWKKVAGV